MPSVTEDDARLSPCTVTADGLLTFEFRVAAEVWTGDVANGFAALASDASSSDDMPLSRLGLSALDLVLHGTSSSPPSYFKVDGDCRGTGLKEKPGRMLHSGVQRSSSLRLLPTPTGSCGSNGD